MCGPLGTPWQFRRCDIRNKNKRIIDSGLVVFFEAPHSYTGEDVVELHCHGNPNLVDLVLVEGLSLGLKLAEPGEFTKRAFLNNKIDLAQAESVADLISAQTEEAILAANNSLSGRFSEGINKSIIDSGLGVFFEAPPSYTGDDVVELHCLGNPNPESISL